MWAIATRIVRIAPTFILGAYSPASGHLLVSTLTTVLKLQKHREEELYFSQQRKNHIHRHLYEGILLANLLDLFLMIRSNYEECFQFRLIKILSSIMIATAKIDEATWNLEHQDFLSITQKKHPTEKKNIYFKEKSLPYLKKTSSI